MFKTAIKLFSISMLLAFMFTSIASAETSTASTTVDDTLVGIEVEEVTKMPTRWSLWWKNVSETITVGLTFDDVKKAEKQIMFAEERLRMAEYIVNNTTDDKKRAWAENMIKKSDKLMERIEKTKEKWANHPDATKKNIVKNVANLQLRKDKYLDRIEKKIPEARMEQFEKLRAEASTRGKRIMKALENENVSTEVKNHLRSVKTKVEAKHKLLLRFQTQRKDLSQAVRTGSTTAKDALVELQTQRREKIKAVIETQKKMIKPASNTSIKPIRIIQKINTTTIKRKPVVKPLPKPIIPKPIIQKTNSSLKAKLNTTATSSL